jgi:hypothetical protein
LATNFVFFEGTGVEDIRNILACAKTNPGLAGLKPRDKIKSYINRIATNACLDSYVVAETLSKVVIEERKTGIDQPDLELIHALGELEELRVLQLYQLQQIADAILTHIWNSSSLGMDAMVLDMHTVTEDLTAHTERLRAARKRLDRSIMRQLVTPAISAESELLAIASFIQREAIPPGLGRMGLKMALGGIGYADIEQMKDDVSSLDATFVRWKERFGLPEANRRLAHFQSLANRDCRSAEGASISVESTYGLKMLADLRTRSKQTCGTEQPTMFGCRPEHLVGAAGLLSEECRVWWSKDHILPRSA